MMTEHPRHRASRLTGAPAWVCCAGFLVVSLLAVTLLVEVGPTGSAAAAAGGRAKVAPLRAPKTTPAQDARYLTDVAKANPALGSYLQTGGNVAVRALLTDGSAFCAFLRRGGGIDQAMVSVAVGARSVESKTHLPSSVKTFNTVEAVALLTLCRSEQTLIPASDRSKLRQLGRAFGSPQG
jgi:hypothetical protein